MKALLPEPSNSFTVVEVDPLGSWVGLTQAGSAPGTQPERRLIADVDKLFIRSDLPAVATEVGEEPDLSAPMPPPLSAKRK